jgi:hypothetical protein
VNETRRHVSLAPVAPQRRKTRTIPVHAV